MIVVDASAVVAVLLGLPGFETIKRRFFLTGQTIHAPHLIDVEAAQVIRRFLLRGDSDAPRAHQAFADLLDFPLFRYPHEPLLPRIWQLRDNVSAYDATYVALAEALDVPFVTRDKRLAHAAGHRARVEVY
jgi:predicted nucleic acid-binding protein